MRIRQIKPEWWGDKALQTRLTSDCREFYIGLWQHADDAGWLRWNPDEIAAALYSFRSMKTRERQVRQWAQELADLDDERPHLVIERCGRHARLPKMASHQVVAATRRWTKYGQEHAGQCIDSDKSLPTQEGTVGNGTGTGKGTEREGIGDDLLPNITDPELRERLLRKAANR